LLRRAHCCCVLDVATHGVLDLGELWRKKTHSI
jgi:hypothetical protein